MSASWTGRAVHRRSDRLGREVDVGRAGERVGHDERRRGEVVGLDVAGSRGPRSCGCPRAPRPRPACPRSPPSTRRAAAGRCCRCRWCSRSRPRGSRAPRGRAAGPDFREVLGHDLRARRQAGLDVGRHAQPAAHGLPREQARPEHHRRVRGVGAARDRGDHDRAVPQLGRLAAELERDPLAALLGSEPEAALLDGRRERLAERRSSCAESGTRSCGRFGPARLGSTVARSSSSVSLNTGSGVARRAEEALLLRVALDERHLGAGCGRSCAGTRASRRRPGRSRRWRRTRGPCWRSWRGRRGSSRRARARRTRRTSRRRPSCAASG